MRLPTYEECVKIAEGTDNFFERIREVDDTTVHIFGNTLGFYSDYVDPVGIGIDAYELRGISFVKEDDGSFTRYLGLNKFFNINQCPISMEHVLKDKKIITCSDKRDGSLITFIKVKDKIYPKTKLTLDYPQAIMAQNVIERTPNLKAFIKDCIENDIIPICEITSPANRIVLPYQEEELKVLQLRNNLTGEFVFDIANHPLVLKHKVDLTEIITGETISSLMEKAATLTDKEGWVLLLEDGSMVKIKTAWYFAMHSLVTMDKHYPNKLLSYIINETVDDILSQLDDKDPARHNINILTEALGKFLGNKLKEAEDLQNKFGDLPRSDYYNKVKHYQFVSCLSKNYGRKFDPVDTRDRIEQAILKKCYKFEKAKSFISKYLLIDFD